MGSFAIPPGARSQRFRTRIGTINYASGSTPGIPGMVPKSGYITKFDIKSSIQVVTGATAPVVANYGAYGPMNRINVVVGPNLPVSIPAWHLNQFLQAYDAPYTDARAANPVATSSTNNWIMDLQVPLTVDPELEMGAWFAGDVELNFDLQIVNAAAATVFSTVNAATIQGSWDVWVERFSAPAPDQPGGWLKEISLYHEIKLFGTYGLKNGDTNIDLPRDRDILRIFLVFYTGSNQDSTFAPADGLFSKITLLINDETFIYNGIDEATLKMEMLRNYTRQLSAGVAIIDFWDSVGRYRLNRRDVLPTDSQLATSVKLIVTSNSPSNNVDVVVQATSDNPYAQKWIRSAQAKKLIPAA